MTTNATERPEDALRRLITEIAGILRSANAAPGMPDPDESITAALRWLVDDWRIERAANDIDHGREGVSG